MADTIYANSTASALMSKLINKEKEARLLEAKNGLSALKMLEEFGFGDGALVSNAYEFEKLCLQEENNIYDFVVAICNDEAVRDILLMRFHYHNLKCAIKAKYFKKVNFEEICFPFTTLCPPDFVKDKVFTDDYKEFSPFVQEVLAQLDAMSVLNTLSSQKIDFKFDIAMFDEIFSLLKKCKEAYLKNYYFFLGDIKNLTTAIRCKKYGLSSRDSMQMLNAGGYISLDVFEKFFEGKDDELYSRLSMDEYKALVKLAFDQNSSITEFELLADDTLLMLFKKQKYLPEEGLTPFISYVFARETIIKNVRVIMVGINNNLQKTEIKRRLRETFDGI